MPLLRQTQKQNTRPGRNPAHDRGTDQQVQTVRIPPAADDFQGHVRPALGLLEQGFEVGEPDPEGEAEQQPLHVEPQQRGARAGGEQGGAHAHRDGQEGRQGHPRAAGRQEQVQREGGRPDQVQHQAVREQEQQVHHQHQKGHARHAGSLPGGQTVLEQDRVRRGGITHRHQRQGQVVAEEAKRG